LADVVRGPVAPDGRALARAPGGAPVGGRRADAPPARRRPLPRRPADLGASPTVPLPLRHRRGAPGHRRLVAPHARGRAARSPPPAPPGRLTGHSRVRAQAVRGSVETSRSAPSRAPGGRRRRAPTIA